MRIELFDDEVDSIRIFAIEDQLSVEKVEQVVIFPARERLFIGGDLEQIKERIWQDAQEQSDKLLKAGRGRLLIICSPKQHTTSNC